MVPLFLSLFSILRLSYGKLKFMKLSAQIIAKLKICLALSSIKKWNNTAPEDKNIGNVFLKLSY